ncbi:MAG TPA: hypothetical protein VNZ23_00800 [Xanthobacteraceae bacterium]|nr:hypothetical protein [Xanthobacteraceae bacterium]
MVGPGQPAKRLSLAAMVLCAAACPSFSTAAFAGSARDYLNAPVDAWLVMYNAGYVTSVTPEGGTDISSRTVSNAFLQSVVLTRTMDFWGRAGGLSIVLPYAVANTSSSAFQGSTNGVSDVALLWQINIFGGPALTREQFRSFVPQTFSSFHLYIGTPLGTLRSDFADQSEREPLDGLADINYSHTLDRGWTWIETYFTAQFFTNNNNFFVNGARTLAQNPIFRMEEHISRNLTDRFWLSADAYYNVGGETSIDGTPQDNAASTLRVGAGMGLRLWRGADLGLNYERVVAKPAGDPDSQTIRLSLRQFW